MTPDVNIVLLDFKDTKQREMITENEDGCYSVFINSRFTRDKQLEAYKHAMKHVYGNDFQDSDVQTIESIAHETDD